MTTKEDFIIEANDTHRDQYDYSEVEFVNMATPVKISCPKHNVSFNQAPSTHLFTGCPTCNSDKRNTKHIRDIEIILKSGKLSEDYTLVRYVSAKEVYLLGSYGEVSASKDDLMRGSTPTIRSAVDKTDYFINKSKELHGGSYDYSKVEYTGYNIKVEIFCNDCKEYFYQKPALHLRGCGCSTCANSKRGGKGSRKDVPPSEIDRGLLSLSFNI